MPNGYEIITNAFDIFPIFDRPNLIRRLKGEEQTHNRNFFCSIMAAYALTSAHVRDGALVSPDRHSLDLRIMPPEIFFVAAEEALPNDLLETNNLAFCEPVPCSHWFVFRTVRSTQRTKSERDVFSVAAEFYELHPATGGLGTDIYGFQAANIQAKLALLQIVLFSLEGSVDVERKCSVATDVLMTFHQVPKEFQRAISTPLTYHIAGIGNILGSVMEGPLTERSYTHVRELLTFMAALLEGLEAFLSRRTGAGRKLREQVERIDEYMASRRGLFSTQPNQATGADDSLETGVLENNDAVVIENLSLLLHIPIELLLSWDWPLDVYQTNLTFFDPANLWRGGPTDDRLDRC
ncbi:Fc.00g079130.m01.CDS01 [Cosmosporella sp. VM-42]